MELFENLKIETEVEAYIFGLLYADGYVTSKVNDKYYSIGITVSRKDKDHLIKINEYLNWIIKDTSIFNKKYNKKYETSKLYKNDVKLVQRLILLGIKPLKTDKQIEIWEHIDSSVYRHFIRGFFDGDGTICKSKCGSYHWGFVGKNLLLFEWLKNILDKELNINLNIRRDGNVYRLYSGGNCISKKFGGYLYEDATLFLQRKYDKFQNIEITNGKHGMIGISYGATRRGRKKWMAQYRCPNTGEKIYLGLFLTKEEAIYNLKQSKLERNIYE